jgi:hypothetical protein
MTAFNNRRMTLILRHSSPILRTIQLLIRQKALIQCFSATALKTSENEQQRLQAALANAVRSYVRHHYPRPFRIITSHETEYGSRTSPEGGNHGLSLTTASSWSSGRRSSSPKIDTSPAVILAQLNGYKSLEMSKTPRHRTVFLAEGVLARPRQRIFHTATYSLMTKPQSSESTTAAVNAPLLHERKKRKPLPPMIPPDSKIYRILENEVEAFLYHYQRVIWEKLQKTLIQPVQRILGVASSTDKDADLSIDSSTKSRDEKDKLFQCLRIDHETGNLKIVSHIQIHHATLLLPFELDHKPASTLITVGLVILGAVPLVYRSWNFMVAYPGLSQCITVSVIGTVAYGVLSSRSSARTSQALAVARAIAPRVIAQNDAAWLVLQEGATDRLTGILLNMYNNNDDSELPSLSCDTTTREIALKLANDWGLLESGQTQSTPSIKEVLGRIEKTTYFY